MRGHQGGGRGLASRSGHVAARPQYLMSLCSSGLGKHVGERPQRSGAVLLGSGAGGRRRARTVHADCRRGPGELGPPGRLAREPPARPPRAAPSGAGESRVQVRCATRAPGVPEAGGCGRRARAEGLRPAACGEAGHFPAVACAPPRPPPPGLSACGLLLTGRVCAAGAMVCGRVVPPTRVTVLWGGGGEDAAPEAPLCGLTFPERAHPPVRQTRARPTQGRPTPHAFTFQRSCVPKSEPGEAAAGRALGRAGCL